MAVEDMTGAVRPRGWGLLAFMGLFFCAQCRLSAEEPRQLRIGHFPNVTHAQAIYARATGQFEKALGIDMAFVGPNPAINGYLKTKGAKFVIIGGAASGGAGLIIRRDAGINSDSDFNDKIIATPQLGNTQDVAARIWFDQKGYRLKEKGGRLGLVPLSNPDQLTMFHKKQIDGAWTIEPWLSRLEIEGQGVMFLEEKSLWPEGRYVTTQLVVSRAFLSRYRETVKKLLLAHVEVTQQINADVAAAGTLLNTELKKETGKALPPAVVARALTRIEFTWDPIAASLYKCAEAAHRIGFLRTEPRLDGIYELGLLEEVLQEKKLPPLPK
jgi:NitT/TauT family transport system substrate-binding protein